MIWYATGALAYIAIGLVVMSVSVPALREKVNRLDYRYSAYSPTKTPAEQARLRESGLRWRLFWSMVFWPFRFWIPIMHVAIQKSDPLIKEQERQKELERLREEREENIRYVQKLEKSLGIK